MFDEDLASSSTLCGREGIETLLQGREAVLQPVALSEKSAIAVHKSLELSFMLLPHFPADSLRSLSTGLRHCRQESHLLRQAFHPGVARTQKH